MAAAAAALSRLAWLKPDVQVRGLVAGQAGRGCWGWRLTTRSCRPARHAAAAPAKGTRDRLLAPSRSCAARLDAAPLRRRPPAQAELGAAGAIPTLIGLLGRSGGATDDVAFSAAQALDSLLSPDLPANERRLVAGGGVEALLRALAPGGAGTPRVREAALSPLAALRQDAHKLRVLSAGGAPLLVEQLRRPGTPRAPYAASVVLHNLAITGQAAKRGIAAAGALPLLVAMLRPGAGREDALALDSRESAANALCTLAHQNPANCEAIIEAGAVPTLVHRVQRAPPPLPLPLLSPQLPVLPWLLLRPSDPAPMPFCARCLPASCRTTPLCSDPRRRFP